MDSESLGPFQREYSAAEQGRREVLTGGIILALLLAIGCFALAVSKPHRRGIGIGVIGVLGSGLGLYIFGGYRKCRRRVLLHADGLELHDGGTTAAFRWQEVASLTGMLPVSSHGSPVYIGGPMTIELHDGRCFRLPLGYADADVLANFIHEKVLASRLPAVQVQLQRGETVELGPVQVDRGGLHTGDKSLALREVQGIAFTADDLIITRAGGQRWASLKIARFPNANLFLHLIRPQLSL
jgi:uncharacterized protein DUF6585